MEPYCVTRNDGDTKINESTIQFKHDTHLFAKKELFYGTNNNCLVKLHSNQYYTTTQVLLHSYSNHSRYVITEDVVIYKCYYFSPRNKYILELSYLGKLKEKTLNHNNTIRHKFDLGPSIEAIRSTYNTIHPTCKMKNQNVKNRINDKVVKEIILDVLSVSYTK